jgi:hypothetical protein
LRDDANSYLGDYPEITEGCDITVEIEFSTCLPFNLTIETHKGKIRMEKAMPCDLTPKKLIDLAVLVYKISPQNQVCLLRGRPIPEDVTLCQLQADKIITGDTTVQITERT